MFGLTLIQTIVLAVIAVLLIALLGYIIHLIVNRKWNELRALAYKGVLEAERIMRSETGVKKFRYVLDSLFDSMPKAFPFSLILLFFDDDVVETKLQEWYEDLKDLLDDGVHNNSVQPVTIAGVPLTPKSIMSSAVIKPIVNINVGQPIKTADDTDKPNV